MEIEARKVQVRYNVGAIESVEPSPNAIHEIWTEAFPLSFLEEISERFASKALNHQRQCNTLRDRCKVACYTYNVRSISRGTAARYAGLPLAEPTSRGSGSFGSPPCIDA